MKSIIRFFIFRITVILYTGIFLLISSNAFSQSVIKGKITGIDGQALAQATIRVKESNLITLSDSTGFFIIRANAGNTIEFSYVGYENYRIILGNEIELNISLTAIITKLDDVVLIGYGSVKKKDLTGAVASLNEKDFNKGIINSADQLLIGKVSGLQITNNNGQPGGASTIRIRGNSALSGTGQPLFVIDGVPLDGRAMQAGTNPLNFINPDDIATIDVLKDASATAIYGSRAAYGVILINTKKGQTGQPKITFTIVAGISSILRRIDVLNAGEFREALSYYRVNSSFDKGGNTNAFDALLQNGFQKNYTIGITGGNDNGKYRLSGNVSNNEGILKYSNYKKYGFDASADFKFLENKKIGIDINVIANQYLQSGAILENGSGQILFFALKWNPTDSLRNADGRYRRINDGNPLAQLDLIRNNLKVTTILGSISPYYKITSWLEYRMLLGINYSTGISRFSINQDVIPPGQPPGTATIRNNEFSTRQITHTLTFNKEIADDLRLTATAGFEYTNFKRKGFSASGNGVVGAGFGNFGIDYTNYIQYSDLVGRSIASYADPTSDMQSYFARAIFTYKEKYLFTATVRADGSSKFGENNRYGYFPSFAGAWLINKEKFFTADFINLLKFRIGWGKTGNQEFPAGSAQARYSFFDGGVLRQANNPNPDLKWQSDRQYNFGLDFSLFNNRISGTLDYFNKATTNLIFPSPPIQPAPPDAVVRWINLNGKILNKGFEMLIHTSLIDKKEFIVDLGINATFIKNSVAGLPAIISTGFVSGPLQVIENGYPMNTFFTRKFIEIDKTTGLSNYEDGGVTYYHFGSPNPKILLGISPILQYKKISLSANLYGAFGQQLFFTPLMSVLNAGGIATGNNIGSSIYKNPVKESLANPSQSPSSRFLFKGDYLKMAHLTVSYKAGHIKNAFKDLNFYISGQNLFIITKYPGFDPEINSDRNINGIPSYGIDYLEYPPSRTIVFGLSFSL